MNLFEQIIGTRPIHLNGEITLYGIPQPQSPQVDAYIALSSELESDTLTNEASGNDYTRGLTGLGRQTWLQYQAKISGYSPSTLARKVYGLDMSLEEWTKEKSNG